MDLSGLVVGGVVVVCGVVGGIVGGVVGGVVGGMVGGVVGGVVGGGGVVQHWRNKPPRRRRTVTNTINQNYKKNVFLI